MTVLQTILTSALILGGLFIAVVITIKTAKEIGKDKDKVLGMLGKGAAVIIFDAAVVTGAVWALAKSFTAGWGIPGF